jgi:hypothetical protein
MRGVQGALQAQLGDDAGLFRLFPWAAPVVMFEFAGRAASRYLSLKRMKMKKLLGLLVLAGSFVSSIHAATPPKLVVTILVDQLRHEYLERFGSHFTNNGFRMFTERGATMTFARYDYANTVTGPGHASFLSGATPSMHGIIANDWFDKNTRKGVNCVEDAAEKGVGGEGARGGVSPRKFIGSNFSDQMRLHYGSKVIGISMKDRGAVLPTGKKPAGAYWFDSKIGEFITSTYYTNELPGWVKEFNGRKLPASFVGQTWDRLLAAKEYRYADDAPGEGLLSDETKPVFPHKLITTKESFEAIMPTPFGNQLIGELAEAAVEGEQLGQGPQPDVLCISFTSIDYAGHRFGPYSQEMQDMVLRLDLTLNKLFNYLHRKFGPDNVLVMLTADHAVAPTAEFAVSQGLAGERLNESEVLTGLLDKLSAKFGPGKYFLSTRFYEGNIYFNHELLAEKKLSANEVAEYIRELALATGKYQAAYTRDQLLDGRTPGFLGNLVLNAYNAERGGDVVLVPKPFVVPGGKTGTTHGSPYMYDSHVPVLFYGKAFKPGRYADEFFITDIAPTLSAALRVAPPSGNMGKPFVKMLVDP